MTGKKLSGIDLIMVLDGKIKNLRTSSFDISFGELANRYKEKEVLIQPDFQRLFRWSEAKQSRFIESLLLELPIPPFFLIENEDGTLELIDGLQRIASYLHFIGTFPKADLPKGQKHNLILTECDIISELNGLSYENLPTALQLKLKNRFVRLEIVRKGSDSRLRYYLFKRLNTGGAILSEQEIRNSIIRILDDKFNKFIVGLSENEDFKVCISTITDDKKLEKYDQELVLRFFAFRNNKEKFRHDIRDFMTDYMEAVSDPERNDISFDYVREESIFEKTFKILRETLAEYAFSRVNEKGIYVLGFTVNQYDALTLGIQKCLPSIDLQNKDQISRIKGALDLIKKDAKFQKMTGGGGKNTRRYLKERISFVEVRVERVI